MRVKSCCLGYKLHSDRANLYIGDKRYTPYSESRSQVTEQFADEYKTAP